MSTEGHNYKTRTSGPFPIDGSKFIVHTFMAEDYRVTYHESTTVLLNSSDMAGQGGEYVSASYNGLPYLLNGQLAFTGQEVEKPIYLDEDSVPGGAVSF